MVSHPPYYGHDGPVTWTALVESNAHSKTALCVVRPCGCTMATAFILCSTTPALSALDDHILRPQHNCSTGTVFLKAAALADSLFTQQGLVLSHVRTYCSSLPGRAIWHITVSPVHMSVPAHTTARCSISLFGVCLRYLYGSQMEEQQNVQQPHGTAWWNHSHHTGVRPSASHCLQQLPAGASSSTSAQPLASTQESNGTTSSVQPTFTTQCHQLTSSGGPHSKCHTRCNVSYARRGRHAALICRVLRALQLLESSRPAPAAQPHPASGRSYADFSTQRRFCRRVHPTPAHGVLSWMHLLERPFGSLGPTTDTWKCQQRLTSPTH